MANRNIDIEGMSCGNCEAAVKGAIEPLSGVERVRSRIGARSKMRSKRRGSASCRHHSVEALGRRAPQRISPRIST